ncbi:MAG: hypothetical protein HPY83_14465 [Anaerolineae bacterium]|nr:hypothetical protein [Anaerolineae bacterium]
MAVPAPAREEEDGTIRAVGDEVRVQPPMGEWLKLIQPRSSDMPPREPRPDPADTPPKRRFY